MVHHQKIKKILSLLIVCRESQTEHEKKRLPRSCKNKFAKRQL